MEEVDIREIVENISYLAEVKDKAMIRNILVDLRPVDLAEIFRHLDEDTQDFIFSLLDAETASEVIIEMDDVSRDQILEDLSEERISEIVDEMDSDDAADLVSDLPEEMVPKILDRIDKEDSDELKELLTHDEESAGGIMAKEFISVNLNTTTDQVKEIIKSKYDEVEDIFYIYITDDENVLKGIVSLKDLILADTNTKMFEIMDKDVISVHHSTDQEEVANIVKRYDLVAIPVVDKEGKLKGRITFDDVADVMEEEASEDIQRMAGIANEEEFRETSVLKISRVRLPWLLVGFTGELVSAYILQSFQASLDKILASAFFIPIIMAMGGNSGIQSSTIMVRGMATGEIGSLDVRKRLWREIFVSLLNGVLCGILLFSATSLWLKQPRFGLILGFVLIIIILNAAFVGALVPVILKNLKIDPAIATGPFITTSNDVLGLLIYLGLITVFLPYL